MTGRFAPARLAGPALTLVACGLLWLFWRELGILRGTFLWEIRLVAFAVTAFLLLSLAEWAAARLAARLPGAGTDPPSTD